MRNKWRERRLREITAPRHRVPPCQGTGWPPRLAARWPLAYLPCPCIARRPGLPLMGAYMGWEGWGGLGEVCGEPPHAPVPGRAATHSLMASSCAWCVRGGFLGELEQGCSPALGSERRARNGNRAQGAPQHSPVLPCAGGCGTAAPADSSVSPSPCLVSPGACVQAPWRHPAGAPPAQPAGCRPSSR